RAPRMPASIASNLGETGIITMSQPNILLITTDQQRYDTINVAGNPHILTPNLNWLCDSGRLFACLLKLGESENTWIAFTSDHGELLGDHFLAAKFLALEASAKIPFIIRAPGGDSEWAQLRGTCSDELVTLADLLPTFSEIGGIENIPAPIDGRDIRKLVAGESESRTGLRFQAAEFHGLLAGNWKYLLASSTGDELLFNLTDDPLEQKNLIGQCPNDHKRLRARLLQLMEHSGLPSVKNGTLNPSGPPTFGNRRGDWPGHHSIEVPSDTLH
ncbi:MAG: sulfatase-like hydrolase/transferase, partial [Oceanipulchritudo sp.]